ncbi:hypothetical protein DXG01_003176 [Tephrocybe rancida]|nr:hypothetical protein DXG01_003176 [Tephrocybe rancida]
MAILPQRPLRGSRISSFYPVKSLPSLASLDSAFQLQEYISLLIRLDVHDVDSIVALPGKRAGKEKVVDDGEQTEAKEEAEEGEEKGKNEVTVDEACWIYEQLRRLAQDLTHPLITMLQQECTRASCPEMKAGEWLYLCVAHGTDGNVEQCCAIDYILHTLDSATALLNTPRAFPSRLQIPQSSHRHFSSLARRLGRIFAHAYFHHREAFEQAEAESSLYARFLALTSKFELVPAEFLVIPTHSGSGSDSDSDREGEDRRPLHEAPAPRLLAAAVDPQTQGQAQGQWERRGSVIPIERAKSSSPPGLSNGAGSESPRKMGRNRTDTMVLHDAYAVAEELAKASPKVPPLDALDEPMSPMDAEEFPKTAKPVLESLEETGSSLPESPILNSPPPPTVPTVPAEVEDAVETVAEEPAAAVTEPPVAEAEAEPATSEEPAPTPAAKSTLESVPAPVEADIAETALAPTEEEDTVDPSVVKTVEEFAEEVAQEAEAAEEVNEAETQEVTLEQAKEEAEEVEVAEALSAADTTVELETAPDGLEVAVEAPAPASEPVVEVVPSTAPASEIEESTPAPSASAAVEEPPAVTADVPTEAEAVADIPEEIEVVTEVKKDAPIEPETEVEAKEKEVEPVTAPVKEKTPELATEPVDAPPS